MSQAFCYVVLTKSMNKQNLTKLRSLFHSQNGLALLSASFIAGWFKKYICCDSPGDKEEICTGRERDLPENLYFAKQAVTIGNI